MAVAVVTDGDAYPTPVVVGEGVMSEADRAHWHQVQGWRARTLPAPTGPGWLDRSWRIVGLGLRLLPAVDTDSVAGTAVVVAGTVLGDAGGVLEAVGITAVAERLADLGTELGRIGLRTTTVVATFRRAGHDVGDLTDVAALEVDDVLATRPSRVPAYVLAAAAQGAAVALLPSLGSVLGRCGAVVPGLTGLLGLVAGASADTVLVAATCARAVALTGAYYGYDPARPDERAVALAVLSVSLAHGSDKHSADEVLRGLQAGHPASPRLTRDVTTHLGARLRCRGVAGIVHATPVVGVGVAALLAGRLLARVLDDADHLYRERFLRDKYGTDPGLLAA